MTYGPTPYQPAGTGSYQPAGPAAYQGQEGIGPQDPPGYYMGHRLAGWGARAGAYLLDALFIAGPAIVLLIGTAVLVAASSGGQEPSQALIVLAFVLLTVAFAVQLGLTVYNRWYLQGKTGQSWGKRIVGVRLVRMSDGQPVGGGMAFVRDVAHTVDGLICYIGYLMPLWDDRRQTLADKLLNTVVLDVR
jgi:uncharacterized RDD family membrane protein YckC